MNFVVYKSVQPHPYAARPWVSSIEATGESRGLSQLINWVSGCFLGKSWNPPKRRQDFWHWEGRAFQPTSMTFFGISLCHAVELEKSSPLGLDLHHASPVLHWPYSTTSLKQQRIHFLQSTPTSWHRRLWRGHFGSSLIYRTVHASAWNTGTHPGHKNISL